MALLFLVASPAAAGPFAMLLESNLDAASGSEVFLVEFGSLQELIDGNAAGVTSPTQLDVSADFDTVGLAHDGDAFHLLEESGALSPATGQEVVLYEYADAEALVEAALSAGGFSALNVGATFDIVGFTYGDSAYHLLLESKLDQGAGAEIFYVAFDSLSDLVMGVSSSSQYARSTSTPLSTFPVWPTMMMAIICSWSATSMPLAAQKSFMLYMRD
ncbi:MAG: hypothetical protein AB8G23_11970 [Myxococcota bacterium]